MSKPHVIYYVNLSLFNSKATSFIPDMHRIELNPDLAPQYEEKTTRAINGQGDSVLNEYKLVPKDCGGVFEGGIEPLYLYGLQTNECALKAVLRVTDIDELIIVASEDVYKTSIAVYNKASEEGHDGMDKGKNIHISNKLAALQNKDFLYIEDIDLYDLYDQEEKVTQNFSRWTNTLDYFILEIRHYITEVINIDKRDDKRTIKRIRSVSVYPIKNDVGRGEMTNCSISVADRALKQTNHELNLIIDTNGGKRDMSMIQIAIIRALKTRGIEARNVLYSNFNRESSKWTMQTKMQGEDSTHSDQQKTDNAEKKENGPVEIQDRSHEYGIFDMVSGIDEFVSYGRVERLQNYFETSTSGIKDVLNSVDLMCKAFMTCFTKDMIDSVVAVRDAIYKFNSNRKRRGASSVSSSTDTSLADEEIKRDSSQKRVCTPGESGTDSAIQQEQYKLARYVVDQIENDLQNVLAAVGGEEEKSKEEHETAEANPEETVEEGASHEAAKGQSARARAILPLIEWCRDKKYYQQAITLYVDRIDAWYYEKGILKKTNDKEDFYSYLYPDCLEKEYYKKLLMIRNNMRTLQPYPYDKSKVVQRLQTLRDNPHLHLNTSKFDDAISIVNNCYDDDGHKKIGLTGNQNNLSKQLKGYMEQLQRDINNKPAEFISPDYKNNHSSQIEAEKSLLCNEAADLCPALQYPKNSFLNEMSNISCTDLDIDQSLFLDVVNDINNGYDNNGDRQRGVQLAGPVKIDVKNLYDAIGTNICDDNSGQNGLHGSYRKVCDEYRSCESLKTQLDPESRAMLEAGKKVPDTYVKKKICIEHYSAEYSDKTVLLNETTYNERKMEKPEILKQIAQFYLAFKIIRNNTNHSNGKGDIYAKVACDWLGSDDGGNVIDLSTCDEDGNTITLKYETTADLLEKAIRFHKTLTH